MSAYTFDPRKPINDIGTEIAKFLSDPSGFPAEFKNWVTHWVEAYPPAIPFAQVSGYALATAYAVVGTPGSVASGTSPVAVNWTAQVVDAQAMWATGSNTRITCKQAGTYLISAHLDFGTNTTGTRHLYVRLGGATVLCGVTVTPTAQGSPLAASALYPLAVNDYLEVTAIQNSGGGITPTGFFSAVRVSP